MTDESTTARKMAIDCEIVERAPGPPNCKLCGTFFRPRDDERICGKCVIEQTQLARNLVAHDR